MKTDSLREELLVCLGGDWPTPPPLASLLLSSTQMEGYRLESISYQVEPGCRVPALLLIPDQATPASPAPAIAVWHQHNGQWQWGKSEPAGLVGDSCQHVGVALAQAGYVVLCPDSLCFEDAPVISSGWRRLRAFRISQLRCRWKVSGLEEHPRYETSYRLPLLTPRGL